MRWSLSERIRLWVLEMATAGGFPYEKPYEGPSKITPQIEIDAYNYKLMHDMMFET